MGGLWEVSPRIARVWLQPRAASDPRVRVIAQPAWFEPINVTFKIDTHEASLTDDEWKRRYPCQVRLERMSSVFGC